MRLFEQGMNTAISKDNDNSLWTESNAGLRATKHHIPGRLATNIEFVDSSSSLSSDEVDTNAWTTQCTGKREAPRRQASQKKATKKSQTKEARKTLITTSRKVQEVIQKQREKIRINRTRKQTQTMPLKTKETN